MSRLNLNPTADEMASAMELADGRRFERDELPEGAVVHWPVYDEASGHVIRLCLVARYNGDLNRARSAEAFLRAVFPHNWSVDPGDPSDWDLLNCTGCIAQRQA